MLSLKSLTEEVGWVSFLRARVEAVLSFQGNDPGGFLLLHYRRWAVYTGEGRTSHSSVYFHQVFYIYINIWTEEKTNHVSLRLFVYQPLMTCMWIWWTHSFDAAAPKLNLGSANVCFPVVWIFPPRFICNRTSAVSCMYGHIQPLQRGRVQRILLHFLNKNSFYSPFGQSCLHFSCSLYKPSEFLMNLE